MTAGTSVRLMGLRDGVDLGRTRYDRYRRVADLDEAIRRARRMIAANDTNAPTSVRVDWAYRVDASGHRTYRARLVVTATGVRYLWETDAGRIEEGDQ